MAAIRIFEVGPRDGLQNVTSTIPTDTKLGLISRLTQAGVKNIEITSVVSPRAIPQLADNSKILSSFLVQKTLREQPDLRMSCLVPNLKGLDLAVHYQVKEVAVFVSATEGFSRANINCSVEEGLRRARAVTAKAKEGGMAVRGYVSCIFADPYDGPTPMNAVYEATAGLLDAGCYEVSLGDTLGVGTVLQVRNLVKYLHRQGIGPERLAGHFHDTYGQALSNVWEAYLCGVRTFDSSIAGLGGCPFAPGARGNLATEDLVYLFEHAGVDTGLDIGKLAVIGDWISGELRQSNQSRAGTALLVRMTDGQRSKSKEQSRHPDWALLRKTDLVSVFRGGANGKIVLHNQEKGNVLSSRMISNIDDAFSNLDDDDSITRIVITAEGRFFCTGMDLGIVGTDSSSRQRATLFRGLSRLLKKIANCCKTTIASINGPAFGGGVGLAFACDLRVCARSSSFTLSEAKLGLCPAVISEYVVREWGTALARQAMLTGRPVSAEELQSIGVVTVVCNSTTVDLEIATGSLLDSLRFLSPGGSRMCKELVTLGWKYGGQPEQEKRVSELFDEMLQPGTEGAFGAAELQARRKVDWDAYRAGQRHTVKPKL